MSKNPAVNPLEPLQFNPNAKGNKPAKIVFLLLFFSKFEVAEVMGLVACISIVKNLLKTHNTQEQDKIHTCLQYIWSTGK